MPTALPSATVSTVDSRRSPRGLRPSGIRNLHPGSATRPTAVVRVDNLRLRTFIGFNDEERVKQQDVVINIRIDYGLTQGAIEDHVEDALNYKTITKRIIAYVEGGRFLLLERLAADVLAICSESSAVHFAQVRIDKPHALRFADSVSVTLEYAAEESNSLEKLA